jgi:hypothetical protein
MLTGLIKIAHPDNFAESSMAPVFPMVSAASSRR